MTKVFVLIATLLTLCACAKPISQAEVLEIVVVPQTWSEALESDLKQLAKDRPELNVYQNTAQEADALYQALLLRDLTAQEVDAICLDPIDEALAAPYVEAAQEAGITVIIGNDFSRMIEQAAQCLQ